MLRNRIRLAVSAAALVGMIALPLPHEEAAAASASAVAVAQAGHAAAFSTANSFVQPFGTSNYYNPGYYDQFGGWSYYHQYPRVYKEKVIKKIKPRKAVFKHILVIKR